MTSSWETETIPNDVQPVREKSRTTQRTSGQGSGASWGEISHVHSINGRCDDLAKKMTEFFQRSGHLVFPRCRHFINRSIADLIRNNIHMVMSWHQLCGHRRNQIRQEHNTSQEEGAGNLKEDEMESLRTLLESLPATNPARSDPSSRPSLLENCDDIFETCSKTLVFVASLALFVWK